MNDNFERGIVVDPDGYFVAALKWEKGTPAPKVNERSTKGTKDPKLIILRDTGPDSYVTDNASPNARWNFTEVKDENGRTIRRGTWELPSEERWIVVQRRDIPDYWFLNGSRKIWPERLKPMPEGSKLVSKAPPDVGQGRKPIWSDEAQDWLVPKRIAVCEKDGQVKNIVNCYSEKDLALPEGGFFVESPEEVECLLENGTKRSLVRGDFIGRDSSIISLVPPKYKKFPVSTLIAVAADISLDLMKFLESKGYSKDDIISTVKMSLGNPLLREFIEESAMTIEEAYEKIELRAQEKEEEKASKIRSLEEEI